MLTNLLSGGTNTLSVVLCAAVSIFLGLIIAVVYMLSDRNKNYSKNFVISIVLLPVLVQSIILLVNGNLGAGVAVAGAFSLIRFRSAVGSAKEISVIFSTVSVGIATGMGYIYFAMILAAMVCIIILALSLLPFADARAKRKDLRITIPENLNFTDVFDDLFEKYTKSHRLLRVKTSNLGSLYDLSYSIVLKDEKTEKEFIDELRCRNGNLSISCAEAADYISESL